MPIYNNVSGTWKNTQQVYVNVGGVWKACTQVFVNVGGSWHLVFSVALDITINSNTYNFNAYNAAVAAGWNSSTPIQLNITVGSGVAVGSTTTAAPSFATGSGFPAGSTLTLINNGYIAGMGGGGGMGTVYPRISPYPYAGAQGGPALNIQYPITITNNGMIFGGGGGGAGAGNTGCGECYDDPGGSGGGGAGFNGGLGAPPGQSGKPSSYAGQNGTLLAGGNGGYPSPNSSREWGSGYNGGHGGGPGAAGAAGSDNRAAGGQPGYYVIGNANVTWQTPGTLLGLAA